MVLQRGPAYKACSPDIICRETRSFHLHFVMNRWCNHHVMTQQQQLRGAWPRKRSIYMAIHPDVGKILWLEFKMSNCCCWWKRYGITISHLYKTKTVIKINVNGGWSCQHANTAIQRLKCGTQRVMYSCFPQHC